MPKIQNIPILVLWELKKGVKRIYLASKVEMQTDIAVSLLRRENEQKDREKRKEWDNKPSQLLQDRQKQK